MMGVYPVYAQSGVEYNTVQNVRIYAPGFTNYKSVEGSPYVPSDTMQNGWLLNGQKPVPVKLRYNSYTGTIEYKQDNQILTPTSSIAEFAILTADTLHFRKGFPATRTRAANDFYQILFDGRKLKLVKYISSTITTNTDRMHDDFGKKKFQIREEYYVWVANEQQPPERAPTDLASGSLKSVVVSHKALLNLFPQQSALIDQYVAGHNSRLKSWADFAGVLRYLDAQ